MGTTTAAIPLFDFISFPELGLSILGVIAVFVGLSGFMILVTIELAEEGHWIWSGAAAPILLLLISLLVPAKLVLQLIALVGIIATPAWLGIQRPKDCAKAVIAGLALFVGGGAVVALVLSAHYSYFVR